MIVTILDALENKNNNKKQNISLNLHFIILDSSITIFGLFCNIGFKVMVT